MLLWRAFTGLCFVAFPSTAMAVCWNAEESGSPGPAVEICINEQCETTRLTSECPLSDALIAGYANGLSVAIDLSASPPVTKLSKSGVALSPEEVQTASCRELEGGDGCKFGKPHPVAQENQGLTSATNDNQIAAIREHFKSLIGVDAEAFQNILIEANLLNSKADGVWGAETEAAVKEALQLADLKGIRIVVSTADAMFSSFHNLGASLFDPRSGLARQPFDGAQLLVVASRRTYEEAEPLAVQLEASLSSADYANRTAMIPSLNGWVAVTAGMYSDDGCQTALSRLQGNGLIPADSYCAPIEKFDPMAWTN